MNKQIIHLHGGMFFSLGFVINIFRKYINTFFDLFNFNVMLLFLIYCFLFIKIAIYINI